ncbi:structural maintenance of chromosomes protein 4 [Culicoides brevitarsis]|uniref:structural maintenance of chromosomes protein 4 n=1 Tax=Culicoides brevitarsis TaxID=469753 RepID=UPI00307BFE87
MPPKAPPEEQPMDVDEDDFSEDEEGGRRVAGIYIPPPIKPYCSTESKGPRLMITKMVCEDFKSYADTVTLGPFHHQFSAVIGPNGSGKSNVIDAMLFVFGYRAQKIRSKKISVLLHKSSKKPNVKQCKVEVHFTEIIDKPDGTFEKVPNTEFVVARLGYDNNGSDYLLNGRKTSFKEVAKMLKGYGIDLDHNRFLILQGEVESIAMMKSKAQTPTECGLLEYLEDIIGTTRYKKPLQLINERVEELNEKRTEKHNRCKMAEREMKDLEKPMKEAVEHLKLENSFFRTQNLQIQKYLQETKQHIKEAEDTKTGLDEELTTHDAQYTEFINERKEKEKIIEENTKKKESLTKRKEDMETALKAADRKYTQTQESMVAANKRRKTLKTQLEKEKEKLEELKKVPEKNEKEITESEKKIEKLTKQKSELDAQLEENLAKFKEETVELQQQKEEISTKLIELKKKSDADKAALVVKEQELKVVTSGRTTEIRKYETLKNSLEDSKKSLEEKKERIVAAKKEFTEAKTTLDDITQKCQSHQRQEQELTERVRVLRSKIEQNNQEMQAKHTHGKVLDFLMAQKKKGTLPGVIGRLGDLGGIDAKYDVAISNACGKLDNILVDTVDTAQACIEALRKHNVGSGTFIALDKMQKFQENVRRKIQTPENVPRLFDLVKVEDESVLPAFYFALRDTVVANDLDQGTRIAYGAKRWRVVSLQGGVIETSGTMTGGGRSVLRGKMGQKVQTKTKLSTPKSNKELEGWMVEAERLQNQVNELQREQGEWEAQIRPLQQTVTQRDNEIRQLENAIRTFTNQLPKVEEQVKRQEEIVKNTHSDENAVKVLEKEIAALRAAFDKSLKATNELQAEVTAIDQQINDINNKKVKGLRTKIKDLKTQIDKLTSNVSKLRAELDANERNIQKAEERIENCQTEIATAETDLRQYDAVRKECVEDKEQIEEKLKEISEELSTTDSGFGDLKKEIAALQKKENEGRMKRLEIEQKLEAVNDQIKDFKRAIPHWENKLKPLKLHKIPNEDEPEPFKQYTEEELNGYAMADIQYQYTSQEEQLSKSKPNFSVIDEFNSKRGTYLDRVRDLEDVTAKRNEMRQTYDDVRKLRFSEFMAGFNIITKKLKEMYRMITLGGDAELELVDSMDPFNEGIVFSVRPPKKSWKSISNLSGGEKTLSSLALVFALHYYKPSPLYVMDEIDAALDFKNVSIVANYIKDRTKNAQFIIISLRANMFELSDYLVGICKYEDCTKSCTVKNIPPPRPTQPMTLTQSSQIVNADLAFNSLRDTLSQRPSTTQSEVSNKSVEEEEKEAELDESGLNSTVIENPTVSEKTLQEIDESVTKMDESVVEETIVNESSVVNETSVTEESVAMETD